MATTRDIHINVPVLTRIEGEGALELDVVDGVIERLDLRIFEPPRLFEKFVEGYECNQVIDMVARICGICPVAYQMSAVQAFEGLFGFEPPAWLRDLRRAMYCGEWLQSHALHIHLLAAPDFLGFESAIAMAAKYPEAVRRGLALQTLGNDLIALFGGRSVHPVGRGGRTRWKIENETINTLKNQGYRLEHNYGHGTKNLSVVLALLMMLAFLVDQAQQLCCPLFRAVWKKLGSKRALWDNLRSHFRHFRILSMRQLHEAILYDLAKEVPLPAPDTS